MFPALSLRTGQGLPGFLASHPVALRRSPTPADPWRLAVGGASGAAPTLSRMKASTWPSRGSIASLHHPLCTLHDVRHRTPCNTRFRLAGCAFAGRESNPLARDEGLLAQASPPSRTSPGATTIWMGPRLSLFVAPQEGPGERGPNGRCQTVGSPRDVSDPHRQPPAEMPRGVPRRASPTPCPGTHGDIVGALLRLRDRTARPPRVPHRSSAVNMPALCRATSRPGR